MLLFKHSSCLILVLTAPVAFSAEPFEGYTKVDLIVVAELKAGEFLQRPPECSTPGTLCLDPPPFWLAARIISTVYGESPPSVVRFTTSSHFGMKEYQNMVAPQLVFLRTDGVEFVMPRYSREPLVRDKNGKLYLRTFESPTIDWLPCETATLREEIYPSDFDEEGLEITTDRFSRYSVMKYPSMYRITRSGAWPRYAIPVHRLRDFFAKAGPDVKLACESEQ